MRDGLFCHATAVDCGGAGVLILGASGSGKSGLALDLISRGGRLICDDGVHLTEGDDGPVLGRPDTAPPLIEARFIGLIGAPVIPRAPLRLAVDLDRAEPDRLPPRRRISCLGTEIPLILGAGLPHLGPAIPLYLIHGRAE